jgi:hypothetical protein
MHIVDTAFLERRGAESFLAGNVEIFLVPIGPDATGMRYEAVFN